MPFRYDLPLPDELGAATLVAWLLREGERFHEGTAFALVETPAGRFELVTRGPGNLLEHCHVPGAPLARGVRLAVAAADGESIPYGKPYTMARS